MSYLNFHTLTIMLTKIISRYIYIYIKKPVDFFIQSMTYIIKNEHSVWQISLQMTDNQNAHICWKRPMQAVRCIMVVLPACRVRFVQVVVPVVSVSVVVTATSQQIISTDKDFILVIQNPLPKNHINILESFIKNNLEIHIFHEKQMSTQLPK